MAMILKCLVLGFLYRFSVHATLLKSHYGKQFYIGMIGGGNMKPDFQIDIASEGTGNAYLDIPYLNEHRNVSLPKGGTTLTVSNSLIREGTFTENRGIYLRTDVPVAVYVSWQAHPSVMETYLALPMSSLGTRYSAASYDPCSNPQCSTERSEVIVVGAHDNTTVTITDRYQRNTTYRLNTQDVHQLASLTDISFEAVASDKPVTVISGTSCAFVPHDVFACDMLLEQMIPVSGWDKTVIVPPTFPRLGFVIKAFSENNATVCLKNSSRIICKQTYQEEFLMGTDPVLITSNASISAVQYSVGQEYDKIDGDEFTTVIPGLSNYLNSYYFVIPSVNFTFTNHLSIIIPSTEVGGLRLDGSSVAPGKTYLVPDPFSNYSVLIINITIGYHELTHINTAVMFGVTAYGYGYHIGYGFPVGFGFLTDTEIRLTTHVHKPTTTSAPESTSVHLADSTTIPTQTSKNVTCYACDDLSYVELCDVVQHCSVNEVCYLKSYVKFGRKLYRSGCMQYNMCMQEMDSYQHVPNKCVECCSGPYCNHKGCGDNGLVPRNQRGPLCYDCSYERSPDDCNKLTLCEPNESCSVEEFKWGEHSHFIMGCTDEQCSRSSRSVHIANRALPVCRSCCADDYCNLNCTRSDVGSILVG